MTEDRRRPGDQALDVANAAMLIANTAATKMEAHASEDKRMHEELNKVLEEIKRDVKDILLTMAEQRGARKLGYVVAGAFGAILTFIGNSVVKIWAH